VVSLLPLAVVILVDVAGDRPVMPAKWEEKVRGLI
jgi:hypothetical protein